MASVERGRFPLIRHLSFHRSTDQSTGWVSEAKIYKHFDYSLFMNVFNFFVKFVCLIFGYSFALCWIRLVVGFPKSSGGSLQPKHPSPIGVALDRCTGVGRIASDSSNIGCELPLEKCVEEFLAKNENNSFREHFNKVNIALVLDNSHQKKIVPY